MGMAENKKFISIPWDSRMVDRARTKAKKLGGIKNSILKGGGNAAGYLGEEAVASYIKAKIISCDEGNDKYGKVIATVKSNKVRKGSGSFGKVIANIDNSRIREGEGLYNEVLLTIDDDRSRKGNGKFGSVLANVSNGKLREGNSRFSKILATGENCTSKELLAASVIFIK